uniref:t-SNARE coiled-coil homology domain-containing protein n=1 Tax=Eucampia antarctica TaxID=49252 RepID=A0A7S2R9T6_9STRA|mmetsp:Transcript_18650/g.17960  ORF Transcript_18650/g.17960 Transcript_18650/m.17960 type:complete len:315 (+) Transcript_18650:51-995(+)
MASRDLTAAFIERRSAANMRRRSGASGRMKPFGISQGNGSGKDNHMLMEEGISITPAVQHNQIAASLPPQWVDDVDGIHELLSDCTRMMGILGSMHASRVGTVFGRDLDDMEQKIERITNEITDKFRQAERLLQRVGIATKRAGGEQAAVGANVQRSLAKKLQELSVEFRQKQRKYLTDVQAQKSGGVAETESKFGIDLNEREQDYGFNQQQTAVVDDLQEAVQSRDHEISQIAKSIEELGAIFKELAVLVIDQGTILDRIDYNMETVVEHTKTGIKQLEKAEKSQKSGRPMKCIMCLMCAITVLSILLLLKNR